jgi:glycosidase
VRGLRVITELVINHTSDQHPWFQRARAANPGSAARNFYVWANTDRGYKDAPIIFLDTEKSNWTWDDQAKAFYWHRFYAHQPDLNFDNPRVLEAVLDVMAHWLDMGVDGLRLDAIPLILPSSPIPQSPSILRHNPTKNYVPSKVEGVPDSGCGKWLAIFLSANTTQIMSPAALDFAPASQRRTAALAATPKPGR